MNSPQVSEARSIMIDQINKLSGNDSRTLVATIGLRLCGDRGIHPRRREAQLVSRHGMGVAEQSRSLPRSRQCFAWLRAFDCWRFDQLESATIVAMPHAASRHPGRSRNWVLAGFDLDGET